MKPNEAKFLKSINVQLDLEPLYSADNEKILNYLIEKIKAICADIECNANHYSSLNENAISSLITSMINQTAFFSATRETNSRGHVDITITCPTMKDEHEFKYLGEAKIWKSPGYAISGFDQLNTYTTGRNPNAFLIFYFKQEKCDTIFKSYVDKLISLKGGEIEIKEGRYAATKHIHSSTAEMLIDHYAIHVHVQSK